MSKAVFKLNIPGMRRRMLYSQINDKLAGIEPPKTDTTGQASVTTTTAKPGDPYLVIPATVCTDEDEVTIYGNVRVVACN